MSPQKLKQALIKIKDTLHGWSQKLSWRPLRVVLELFGSWWQMIAIALAALIFLYYPLGGWLVEDIDTDTGVEISPANESQSATAEMMSYLIRREVNDKIWTPNLPFFFPSYLVFWIWAVLLLPGHGKYAQLPTRLDVRCFIFVRLNGKKIRKKHLISGR